jgi:hypothetical protein
MQDIDRATANMPTSQRVGAIELHRLITFLNHHWTYKYSWVSGLGKVKFAT